MPSLQTLINESDAIGALSGINLTGDATAVTQPVDDNSTKIATTAYVINQGYLKAATASSTYLSQSSASSTYLTQSAASAGYQPLDGDLTAIAGLAGSSGLLKKIGANSWQLDTATYLTTSAASSTYLTQSSASSTYLTQANASSTYQAILVSGTSIKTINGTSLLGSGDITISGGSGGFALTDGDKGDIVVSGSGATWTLDTSGVTAGTYNDSATAVRPFTVDAKGRITAIGTAVTITPAWSSISSKPTTLAGFGITDGLTSSAAAAAYQPLDADLTAIAGLSGTTGFLKKTAANSWELDTSTYLTTSAAASAYQALDADLTAIAGLAGTSGFLKKDAANTWSLDTSTYLTTASAASTYLTTASAASTYQTQSGMSSYLTTSAASSTYQTILVSGTSIKTINGQTLLGSGNIEISGGGGSTISGAILNDGYAEETYNAGTVATPFTVNLANGSIQLIAISVSTVINLPTPTGNTGKSFTLAVKIGGTGAVIISWDANIRWPGNTPPIISGGNNLIDRFTFVCTGSTWIGSVAGQSYASTAY